MNRTTISAGLMLICVAGAAARADGLDEADLALAYGDKDTVSIATGSAQPLRRAPAVATAITAEEIRAMGARDLDEVLETVPGLHVSRTALDNFSTYSIRGIFGNLINPQVLMLQNGIPTNSIYRGDKGQVWAGLPVENIARIEIIRGPGSALYGADAFAGVVNIITKTHADAPGTEFGVRAGSFDTQDAWLLHGGRWGAVDVATYLRLGGTDGSGGLVAEDAQSVRDRRFGTSVSLAPGAMNNGYDAVDASLDLGYDKWRFRAGYKLRDDVGTGAGITSALDPVGSEKGERINADLSWTDTQFSQDWGLGVIASYLHYMEDASLYQMAPPGTSFDGGNLDADGRLADPALCGPGNSCFPDGMLGAPARWERQLRLSAFATYGGFADHNVRVGLGHDDLDLYRTRTLKNFMLVAGAPPIPLPVLTDFTTDPAQAHILPHRRTVDYLYAQDEWNFAQDWTLTAGVRHDQFSDFGGTTNPRLALVWDAAQDLTAKLLYGHAFRAPSFGELYSINPVSNGNPDLRPETIRTLEAAFAWQARRDTQVNLSLFRYEIEDMIRPEPNPAPTPGTSYQNTGGQHGLGLELEATWDAGRNLRLSGNYAWQRSIDEASDQDAGYAPHHHLYARADWNFSGPWRLGGQVNWVAGRERAAGDTRPEIADYITVDLTLRRTELAGRWDVAVMARNVFDADAREPTRAADNIYYDLPLPGRSLYLELRYRL